MGEARRRKIVWKTGSMQMPCLYLSRIRGWQRKALLLNPKIAPMLHPGPCSLSQPPSATAVEQEDDLKELSECHHFPWATWDTAHTHPHPPNLWRPKLGVKPQFKIRQSRLPIFWWPHLLQDGCLLCVLSSADEKFIVALENVSEKFEELATDVQGKAAPINSCPETPRHRCSVWGTRAPVSSGWQTVLTNSTHKVN